jgi:hypothetical protein
MNGELHNLERRRFAFHEIYLNRVATTAEAADFVQWTFVIPASFS